jgi:hypothetical protein
MTRGHRERLLSGRQVGLAYGRCGPTSACREPMSRDLRPMAGVEPEPAGRERLLRGTPNAEPRCVAGTRCPNQARGLARLALPREADAREADCVAERKRCPDDRPNIAIGTPLSALRQRGRGEVHAKRLRSQLAILKNNRSG